MHHSITIDGPAASGKTTVGRLLAAALNYLFLDTGSMYRAVTLAVLDNGIDVADEAAVVDLAHKLDMRILTVSDETDGRDYTVLVDSKDITWQLRSAAVDANVSLVSSYKGVRAELVRRQREIGQRGAVVMVGRDIGTVVLPDAPLKLYMTASAEERARRRWHDRQARGGDESYDAILADVVRRDTFDSSRQHDPLRPAADAIIIDTTAHPPETIVDDLLTLSRQRFALNE